MQNMQTKNSLFLEYYKNDMVNIMTKVNPNWDESDIRDILDDMIDESICNPDVTLDNNFTGEQRETKLLSVFDWILNRKPIIAGNGTFYKNQHEAINPIAKMLDMFLSQRKAYKKQMFKVGEEKGTECAEYKDLDRFQGNEKVNANSYYGGSGAKSSAFYSEYSGPATTLSAQSVISTTEQLFESFLVNNYLYIDLNEVMQWLSVVLKEKETVELDDFIKPHKAKEVVDKLLGKIINTKSSDETILTKFFSNLSEDEITYIYYKNNMIGFIEDHDYIKSIMIEILQSVRNFDYVEITKENKKTIDNEFLDMIPSEFREEFSGKKAKDWNKFVDTEYFMDPNNPPSSIKDLLDKLNGYIMKYVYTRYISFDKIYRLRNFTRRCVTVIDTDSNILSLDTVVNFIIKTILTESDFGRDYAKNTYIIVNTLTYSITDAVNDILLTYGEHSNIPEEYRPRYNMKNEFFFSLLIIGKAKKRYISKIILREGNLMNPPKSDIKGFDFKKATCSEYAEKRFMEIINKRILYNNGVPDLRGIIMDLRDFEKEIMESIMNHETKFLPNASAKEFGAYADPTSEIGVRGALAWNILYPDDQIEFPAKVSLLKLKIFSLDDIVDLELTNPEIYEVIKDKIFNDKTGFFVSYKDEGGSFTFVNENDSNWVKKIPKYWRDKYKKKGPEAWNDFVESCDMVDPKADKGNVTIKVRGLQALAIPNNGEIPDWVMPYIDYTSVKNNILAPFAAVLELFKNQAISEGKTYNGVNRKTNKMTNIIKF